MTSAYDCMVSALIEAKKRTVSDDKVDRAIELLIKAVKDNKDIPNAEDKLNDAIGDLMSEQFEQGIRLGIQLMSQAMNPVVSQ